ncbi:hypothetical protein EIP86_009020 [Pleurotus ostreatoroseus]|nr:hypothetical protein EIP86_009020 [Pleurotus ostreatoroseus]
MSYRDDGDSASTTHSGPDSQMSKKNRVQAVSVGRDQLPAAPSVRTQSSGSRKSDVRSSTSDEAKSSAQESDVESRKSCSEFAQRMPFKGIENQATTATWMLSRKVFSVATVAPAYAVDGQPPNLQNMIDLYEKYTAFEWVKGWVSTDTMPSVDECVARFPNVLLAQYKDLAKSLNKPAFLEPGLSAIIGSRLTTLFNIVAGAMVKHEQEEDEKIYEAELRLLWDETLTTFGVNHAEEVISRDLNADDSGKPVESLKSQLSMISRLNQAVRIQVQSMVEAENPFLQQCYQATRAAEGHEQQFNSLSAPSQASRLHKMIRQQAQAEPYRGKCDAVMVTSFTINAPANDPSFLRNYRAFSLLDVASEDTQGAVQTETTEQPSARDEPTDAKDQKNHSYHHPLSVAAPNPVANVAFKGDPPFRIPPKSNSSTAVEILFPLFFAEYKKSNTDEIKAINQDRMYMSAAASFLRAIKIFEHPIFSVVTNGLVGAVLMAWASTDGAIYIMERGVRHFDLSDPLQAFHFATVVVRVKAQDEELRKQFDARKEDLELQLSTETYEAWAIPDPPPKRPKSAKQPDGKDSTSSSTSKSARTRSKLASVDEEDVEMLTKQMKATHVSGKRT